MLIVNDNTNNKGKKTYEHSKNKKRKYPDENG